MRACPVCGSRTRRRWLPRHSELCLFICRECGVGYSDPQPRELVRRRYTTEYDLAAHFGGMAARKRILYERRLARLPTPTHGLNKLCDIGCGDGQFLEATSAVGWDAHGIELNPPAAQRARERGATILEGRLEDLVITETGGFNLVTCWDVLEHTPEPIAFAQCLKELVAPGGLLALTTLNRRSLAAFAFRSHWSMVGIDHFTYWTGSALEYLFADDGWERVDRYWFGFGRDFVLWLDKMQSWIRPRGSIERHPTSPDAESGSASAWDSGCAVVRAEREINRILDMSRLGVGIAMTFRKSGR